MIGMNTLPTTTTVARGSVSASEARARPSLRGFGSTNLTRPSSA
jgi:hypothetical protein